MLRLLAVFAVSLVLAHLSDLNTRRELASGRRYRLWTDWAYLLLLTVLVLFAGLRTRYNDTGNYISGFRNAPTVTEWLSDPENFNPFTNPLFYFFQSLVRTYFDDAQVMIFLAALITQTCFVGFFKRYSDSFLFSIFIYFTLGTYVFTLAAIKQVLGMAVATLAMPFLEKRQWGRYYLLVLMAMLIHTYAVAFAVLPLFRTPPWRFFTFLFTLAVAMVMLNFEENITAFMEQANDLGKTLAEYEVFDDATVNIFRLGVYCVPPLISLLFRRWVLQGSDAMDHVFIHMSIISLAFMIMGTQSGANMFGRMANYFELGAVCVLPRMLRRIFDEKSYRAVSALAWVLFFGFFYYANAINLRFDEAYSAISLWEFLA